MNNSLKNYSCPNCNSIFSETAEYCFNCGQRKIHPEDHSVWHLLKESVGDFFHFDSRFFATLWPLFVRPGFLTIEYLQGRRARYFHPFKLFLFISFLYFLSAGILIHKSSESEMVPAVQDNGSKKNANDYNSLKLSLSEAYDSILAIPDDSLHKVIKKYGLNRYVNINFPRESWFARFMIKQVVKNRLQGSLTFSKNMEKTIPKLVFILIPFIALLLKLLYARGKIPYYNHLIFSLHLLSFVFLILWIKLFGSMLINKFGLVVLLLMMLYLFLALLRVYSQKKWVTFGKFWVLFFGVLFTLALFFVIAASISFMMI